MTSFRPGDRIVRLGGVETRLRFTISALAEIADQLQASSPSELAEKLRGASSHEWSHVVRALTMPRFKGEFPESDFAELLPVVSRVIADGLST